MVEIRKPERAYLTEEQKEDFINFRGVKQISSLIGYEFLKDYYYVTVLGEIYSLRKLVKNKMYVLTKIRTTHTQGNFYEWIKLRTKDNIKGKNLKPHRMVAKAFVTNIHSWNGNPIHYDGNPHNNKITNIGYVPKKMYYEIMKQRLAEMGMKYCRDL